MLTLASTTADKEAMSTEHLLSEDVILQAPMSFIGAAKRIWRLTRDKTGAALYGFVALAVAVIALAWTLVLAWYVLFGLLVMPYRVIRRGQRKRRMENLRHREMLVAAAKVSTPAEPAGGALDRIA